MNIRGDGKAFRDPNREDERSGQGGRRRRADRRDVVRGGM